MVSPLRALFQHILELELRFKFNMVEIISGQGLQSPMSLQGFHFIYVKHIT